MKIQSEVANLVVIIYILRMMTTHQDIGLPVVKRNVIFERTKFNLRSQQENKAVDVFITDLYIT